MRVMVLSVSTLTTKTGKDYLNMTVRTADKQELNAKLWSVVDGIVPGVIISGDHKMDAYNGVPQIIFNNLTIDPDQSTSSFEKSTTFDVNKMWDELVEIVDTMKNPVAKKICESLLLDPLMTEPIKRAPAAKGVHNAWFGGLLEHMISLVEMARPLVNQYRKKYSAVIDVDKVIAGCLLHDLGKIVEYNYKTSAFDFNPEGYLVNHIVLGPAWIWSTAEKELNLHSSVVLDEVYQLMHICASHHGKQEWGSPLAPSTLEALLVHHLDNLDAKMMHAIELIGGKQGPVAGFSEKSWCERVAYKQNKQIYDYQEAEDEDGGF